MGGGNNPQSPRISIYHSSSSTQTHFPSFRTFTFLHTYRLQSGYRALILSPSPLPCETHTALTEIHFLKYIYRQSHLLLIELRFRHLKQTPVLDQFLFFMHLRFQFLFFKRLYIYRRKIPVLSFLKQHGQGEFKQYLVMRVNRVFKVTAGRFSRLKKHPVIPVFGQNGNILFR